MFGAMIRAAREELDREYEAQNSLGANASAPARQVKISVILRDEPPSRGSVMA